MVEPSQDRSPRGHQQRPGVPRATWRGRTGLGARGRPRVGPGGGPPSLGRAHFTLQSFSPRNWEISRENHSLLTVTRGEMG